MFLISNTNSTFCLGKHLDIQRALLPVFIVHIPSGCIVEYTSYALTKDADIFYS